MRPSRAVVVLGLLVVASTVAAAPGAGLRCQARKTALVAKAFRDIMACHAIGAQHGVLENSACVAAAHVKLGTRFAKLDAGGHCLSTGDAGDLGTADDNIAIYIRFSLKRPTSPSACTAQRLKLTGRFLSDKLKAYARNGVHPDTVRLYDTDLKLGARYFTDFLAAASLGDCLATDIAPVAVVEDGRKTVIGKLFDGCQDGVKGPGEQCDTNDAAACPFACKPDCTCPFCGDNIVNQPFVEQCDGTSHAACGSSSCQADCHCPPPTCGDNKLNQASEQCDGADDGACHGLCRADCTCPAPMCGNGIVESGEQCDGQAPLACDGLGRCESSTDPNPCTCCYDFCLYNNVPAPCCPGFACALTGTPGIQGTCVPTCTVPTDCQPPYGGCAGGICCYGTGMSCFDSPHPHTDLCCNGCNSATGTCN